MITDGWEMLVHFEHQLGIAVYGLLRNSADGSGVERRRSSGPDCQAASLHGTQRPHRLLRHGGGNGPDYFSIPVFQPGGTGPNQGLFGTLGRNSFRGPAFYNFDFAFIKDTPLGQRGSGAERMGLQFRAEFFNLFNIVNMGLPANILGVSTNTTSGVPSASSADEWLWPDQQDCRQLAADSVLTEIDLLATDSAAVLRQPAAALLLAPPPLCYKGLAFPASICRAANLRSRLS